MNRYYIITLTAVIAMIILQALYTANLHTLYVKDVINDINETMKYVIAEELHERSRQKKTLSHIVKCQSINTMNSHTRDSLLRLHPLPSGSHEVDLRKAIRTGIATTMGEAVQQIFQDELSHLGKGTNIQNIEILFRKRLRQHIFYQFYLYTKGNKTKTIGDLEGKSIDYTNIYPIGTKEEQKLVLKINIPINSFIQKQFWIIGNSAVLFIITLTILFYQFLIIKRKDIILLKREHCINGSIHDLKAPLNNVIALLDLLEDTEKNSERKSFIGHSVSDIKTLQQNMENVLMIAGDKKRHLILRNESTNIESIIENVKRKMDLLFKEKKHNINIDIKCQSPLIIYSDPIYIETIITNLVENALKYSDENVCINIRISKKDSFVKIMIKDNGWGIPKQSLNKIFKQFYQVPRKEHQNKNGHGIGLAQTKYIIKELGGYITVKSINKEGSTFTCYLPINKQ